MAGTFRQSVWDEINERHGGDVIRAARDHFETMRTEAPGCHKGTDPLGVICFERTRFRVDHHYLVVDGGSDDATAEDRQLVYTVAMQQGLESVYADLRKTTVEAWCVVVASLQ